jgi:hypothetical protein
MSGVQKDSEDVSAGGRLLKKYLIMFPAILGQSLQGYL